MRPRRLRRLSELTVLVTGAASGIGRAVATQAAEEGARLVLTDLQPLDEVVQALGDAVTAHRSMDITDADAVAAFAASVGPVDMIFNVAGISAWGTISSLAPSTWRSMVEVNLMGPVHVLSAFVPPMIEAGRGGQIVNVSSAAGVIGMPWHAAYSASKFGLRGVSEVLRFDLAREGIGVSLVVPGAVATPLTETVRIDGVSAQSPRFLKAQARFRAHAVSPEEAADAILKGARRNRYWVYTSGDIRAIHLLQRFFPPAYVVAMKVLSVGANRMLPDVRRATRA